MISLEEERGFLKILTFTYPVGGSSLKPNFLLYYVYVKIPYFFLLKFFVQSVYFEFKHLVLVINI